MNEQNNIIEALKEIGYNFKNGSDYLSCSALYRAGDNETALTIYPKKNLVIDWVTNQRFTIKTLLARTLNLKTDQEINDWCQKRNVSFTPSVIIPKLKQTNIMDKSILTYFLPIHDYFIGRGISIETLQKFKGGLVQKQDSRMKNRYCFPIFNSSGEIVGVVGRSVIDQKIKVKNIGKKDQFVFPAFLNSKIIKQKKEVILVEGIPDVLSLFECGIENVLCLFGTECSLAILNFLLKIDAQKIIISLNNDEPGQAAAEKLENKFLRYFDRKVVSIKYPPNGNKDFNQVLMTENGKQIIKDWYLTKL